MDHSGVGGGGQRGRKTPCKAKLQFCRKKIEVFLEIEHGCLFFISVLLFAFVSMKGLIFSL